MPAFSAQPLAGTDVAAFTLALIALMLAVIWIRDRDPGVPWLVAAFGLYAVVALFDERLMPSGAEANRHYVVASAAIHVCLALGLTRYLRIDRARRWPVLLLALPLLAQAAAASLGLHLQRPLASLPLLGVTLAYCVMSAVAARREPGTGLWWLTASLGTVPALALAMVAGGADLVVMRHYAWPLLIAFGVMLLIVSLLRRRQAIAASQRQALRMASFYQALSRTSQAIVRLHDVPSLYREICRICVETGQAGMAYVGMAEAGQLRVVASAGPIDDLLAGIRIDLDPASPYSQGPAATAMREGSHQVCNDLLADARVSPWRDRIRRTGVRCQASLPIRRGGRVEAVLTVYMDQPQFFDAQIVALLDDMVNDLSFTLDRFDLQAAHAAAEREARLGFESFRQVFEAAPVAATILRAGDRRVLRVNAAACDYYGYRADEMVGRSFAELGIGLAEADRLLLYALVEQQGSVRGFQVPLRSRRGEWRDFVLNWERITFEGHDCLLALGVDVTEARAAERAEQARLAAEAASRAKTEFLSRMSHELRTPLNAMLGFAQLMHDDAAKASGERLQERTSLVLDAGRHLLALVDDVLDVSRIEAGQLHLDLRPVSLEEQLDKAMALCGPLALRRGVQLRADYRGLPLRAVRADALRLRQALLNLLSNAVKYNRPGGRVWLAATVEGPDWMRIDVCDDGPGITPEQAEHLFEPFNRLGREHGQVEGTGLGLVLTRQLVELMQGRLEIDSAPGRGTRASMLLRLADAPALQLAALDAAPASQAEPQGVVLYIEDNPVNLLLVQQLLERWPAVRLLQADSGAEGIALAGTHRPGLVLLDMQLPDMDGIAVLQALQQDPATRALRIVVLSASAMEDEVLRARAHGALDYWTKPLDFEAFLAGVRAQLAGDDSTRHHGTPWWASAAG
jgi:PAS domain S-box-containing protein